MKPSYSQGRDKNCERNNSMHAIAYPDDEGSDYETLINFNASQGSLSIFFGISMFSEHGFILDKGEENLGISRDIEMLIKTRKFVKEFYANPVETNNKRDDVVVRGVKMSYVEETINMHFHMKRTEDKYQDLLDALDDNDFDVYMESLCNLGTKWVELGGEKIVKRIDLRHEMKV
ncbi:hypothetical protein RYX36_031055 [Vicia faba]